MPRLFLRALITGLSVGAILGFSALTLHSFKLEAQLRGCEAFTERRFAPCKYDGNVLTCETAKPVSELIGVLE